ncbi:MAG TPA: hypothetical protein VGE45_01920 [Chloroflexia bacterium]|jgi:hypothetical protein
MEPSRTPKKSVLAILLFYIGLFDALFPRTWTLYQKLRNSLVRFLYLVAGVLGVPIIAWWLTYLAAGQLDPMHQVQVSKGFLYLYLVLDLVCFTFLGRILITRLDAIYEKSIGRYEFVRRYIVVPIPLPGVIDNVTYRGLIRSLAPEFVTILIYGLLVVAAMIAKFEDFSGVEIITVSLWKDYRSVFVEVLLTYIIIIEGYKRLDEWFQKANVAHDIASKSE